MKYESNKLLKEIKSKSIDEVICNWNISRIVIVLGLTLLFQMANLLNPAIYFKENYFFLILIIILICFFAFIIYTIFHFNNYISVKIRKNAYIIFWLIFPLSFTPFFIKNIAYNEAPFNLLIIVTIIAVFPILNFKQTLYIYSTPIIINCLIIYFYDVPIIYNIYAFTFLIAGLCVSITIHGRYLSLIMSLSESCTYDSLTQILNKSSGYQRSLNTLEICKRSNLLFGVYMVDIDFFKYYNDTFGHPLGDKALQQIAIRLKETFCREQDIICRYGGEEFLICCTSNDIHNFEIMAEKLLDNIYDLNIEAGNKSVAPYLTISIGYSIFTPSTDDNALDNTTIDSLIKTADRALYKAKALGRNQFIKL